MIDFIFLSRGIIFMFLFTKVADDPNIVPEAGEDGFQFDANPDVPKEGFNF